LFIALEKGYFKDEGLDVHVTNFANTVEMVPLLISGQLDAGGAPDDPGLFNAMARGVDLRIVAYYAAAWKGTESPAVMVRQDLIDSGKYKSPKDLKGATIGVPAISGGTVLYVEKTLAPYGLTKADVNLTQIGFPDMIPAFANKKLDAAVEVEPFGLKIEQQHLAKTVQTAGNILPVGSPQLLLVYGPNFIQNKPEAAKRYMLAILRGQRDLWHAFDKGDGDKQAIYQILSKYTAIKDPKQNAAIAAKGVLRGTLPNGEMPLDGLTLFQDYFVQNGLQTQKLDFSKIVDPSFGQYAVQQLGRVQ